MRSRGSLVFVLFAVVALAWAGTAASLSPNEGSFAQAWGQKKIDMPRAWDLTTGSPNVVVATVDTGVDPSQPDLQGALVPGWDFVLNTWTTQDTVGHGTLAATIIAGRGNNGNDVAGYCWKCKLMPVRVSSSAGGFDAGLSALGIRWAVDNGARIIVIAFSDQGSASANPQVASAVAYAADHNVLVVASAGNSAGTTPTHPASDPGAYAVAATDETDSLFWWSASGPWVPLAAPGCQIGVWPGKGVMNACGTSTSAPAVGGVAALMLSVNPSLTPAQIVTALRASAVPIAGIGGGRINAYQALLAIGARPPVSPPPPPPPGPPPPPPPAPPGRTAKAAKPIAKPALTTIRTRKGLLRTHWHLGFNLQPGRFAATLRSSKASTCTITLHSSDDAWVSDSHRKDVAALSTRLKSGFYTVDVWCQNAAPRRSSLVMRGLFG